MQNTVINELSIEICNKIINDYRSLYGENHTWNMLIDFLEPDDIANIIVQRLCPSAH
jgi:3-methyladenine DNA glycosylase/8-oxoguanine DNA glycosylase